MTSDSEYTGAIKELCHRPEAGHRGPRHPMWGLSQLSRPPGPCDDSDISSPSQLNSCSSSSAGLAWAGWRLAGWLSEESCRVSLNTAERAAQDTQESLHRRISSNLPYHTSFHSPSLFLLPVIRCEMSPVLHRWGFSDVTGWRIS